MSELVKGRASCHKILLQTTMANQNKGKSSGGAGNHRVAGNVSGLAARGRGAAGSDHSGESSECQKSSPVGTLNAGTSEKVQVGKDQEKAQSEKDSHSKNRGGKKPN